MGLRQRDNGACLITEDGIEFAVSEERLSRLKHDTEFDRAISAATDYAHANKIRIVSAGLSSCGEPPGRLDAIPLTGISMAATPSHHYSHALSAFWMSRFDSSLVIVMDAGGSVLGSPSHPSEWWSAAREQTTVWLGAEEDVVLRRKVHCDPYDIGFGEWWRAFTHYLGWHSHTLTGNTMAAAGYGDGRYLAATPLWEDLTGTFDGRL